VPAELQLTVRDAAQFLSVTEDTVYRWVRDGEIPFVQLSEQYRFNRGDLLEWATARGIPVSMDAFQEGSQDAVTLAAALNAGGVHQLETKGDREATLRKLVELLGITDPADRELMVGLMAAKDALGATALGKGIAIPHVRAPIVVQGNSAVMVLCYLDQPLDVRAADGVPAHTLFSLATPTPKAHLRLLSRLSAALHDAAFREAVARRAPLAEIIEQARRVESAIPAREVR